MNRLDAWRDRGSLAAGGLLLLGAWLMRPYGNFGDAVNVPWFFAAAAVMGAGFLGGLGCGRVSPAWFWMVAVAARLLLFGMTPGNDIYRYLWEGELQGGGYCPYCFAPAAMELAPLRDAHWRMLEHKEVSAIYPPLAEFVFRVVTSVSASVTAMKALFVAADLGVCWLLARRYGAGLALGYAWNPLVIYSFSGGGHYDSLFLLAIVGATMQWEGGDSTGRRLRGALLLGAGVALKWLTLPLLGWALWRVLRLDGVKRLVMAGAAAGTPFGVAWLVVAWGHWSCPLFPRDFTRVARSAEALPALVAWLLPPEHLLNQNSSYLVIYLVVAVTLLWRQTEMPRAAHVTLSAALLTTPMFHAWYGTWITALLPATRSRAAIVLSVSAFVYFWLHHTAGQPGGIWRQTVWEKLLLWSPFVIGSIVDEWARRRVRKEGTT